MPFNILVVEDDVDINRLLGRILSKQEHQIESAFSGSEAKLLLFMRDYDLILLDLMLPGIIESDYVKCFCKKCSRVTNHFLRKWFFLSLS